MVIKLKISLGSFNIWYTYPGRKQNHPRVQYQEQYKKSSYNDLATPNNRPSIQVFDNRRRPHSSSHDKPSELHRKGQYETRRRPSHPNKMSDNNKSHLTPKLNKDENRYDKSRYAEYELGESSSNLKEDDYHLYESSFPNENDNDEYFDDFTPYIQEENGLKIPVLPAPNPSKHS